MPDAYRQTQAPVRVAKSCFNFRVYSTVLTLYDDMISGNGYKVRLMLSQLRIPFRYMPVDVVAGETRTPQFLAINPNGQIPVIMLEDGRTLSQSNAILLYFAEETPLLPRDRFARAEVNQWLFFEQYSHEPYIAVLRFWHHLPGGPDRAQQARLPQMLDKGNAALRVMNTHLSDKRFLVGDRYSIADIALYAYTHVADEGGFDLRRFPHVRDWLARIRELPGHIAIDTACGVSA